MASAKGWIGPAANIVINNAHARSFRDHFSHATLLTPKRLYISPTLALITVLVSSCRSLGSVKLWYCKVLLSRNTWGTQSWYADADTHADTQTLIRRYDGSLQPRTKDFLLGNIDNAAAPSSNRRWPHQQHWALTTPIGDRLLTLTWPAPNSSKQLCQRRRLDTYRPFPRVLASLVIHLHSPVSPSVPAKYNG